MSGSGLNRRDFFRIAGLGGTAIALSGCGNTSIESGAELVESYVQPDNFVVPGVGVYYASTCTQCGAAWDHGPGPRGRSLSSRATPSRTQRRQDLRTGPSCSAATIQPRPPDDTDGSRWPLARADDLGKGDDAAQCRGRPIGARRAAGLADRPDQWPPAGPAAQSDRRGRGDRHRRLRCALRNGPSSVNPDSTASTTGRADQEGGCRPVVGDDFLGAVPRRTPRHASTPRVRKAARRGACCEDRTGR